MRGEKEAVLSGRVCPYCWGETEYIDSSYVYGRSYGMIYICKPCDAYVGVHRGTDRALGRLADRELRSAKRRAHYYFDQIAKTSLINEIYSDYISGMSNRSKAYKWLAGRLGIEERLCHIGMMDVGQCEEVVEICRPYLVNRNEKKEKQQ